MAVDEKRVFTIPQVGTGGSKLDGFDVVFTEDEGGVVRIRPSDVRDEPDYHPHTAHGRNLRARRQQ